MTAKKPAESGGHARALDEFEIATILAGLRMIQRSGVDADIERDLTRDGSEILGDDDIDALCEKINCGNVECYT